MRGAHERPRGRTGDDPLKYTRLSTWLLRQGVTTDEQRTMRLSRALAMMDATLPHDGTRQGDIEKFKSMF